MNDKLIRIFEFLDRNKLYNQKYKQVEYGKALYGCNGNIEKLRSLCIFVYNTQSFPKLNLLLNFLQSISKVNSMEDFIRQMILNVPRLTQTEVCKPSGDPVKVNYNILFKVLLNQAGWGDKTAALFTKIIYEIHHSYPDLGFWDDAPKQVEADDELFLPVDAVILHIFHTLSNADWDFIKVNNVLKEFNDGDNMVLWDDLWFWGFITQVSRSSGRENSFNEAKLWSLQGFNNAELKEIENRAKDFIQKLQ